MLPSRPAVAEVRFCDPREDGVHTCTPLAEIFVEEYARRLREVRNLRNAQLKRMSMSRVSTSCRPVLAVDLQVTVLPILGAVFLFYLGAGLCLVPSCVRAIDRASYRVHETLSSLPRWRGGGSLGSSDIE
jgi:hypothetical protein